MDHVVTIFVYVVINPTFYGRHLQTPDFVLKRARWNTQIVLKDRYLRLSAVRCPLSDGKLRVIADVTDQDAIQTILAHLKQRAPPDAVHQQRPGQGPQNDLFAAI